MLLLGSNWIRGVLADVRGGVGVAVDDYLDFSSPSRSRAIASPNFVFGQGQRQSTFVRPSLPLPDGRLLSLRAS